MRFGVISRSIFEPWNYAYDGKVYNYDVLRNIWRVAPVPARSPHHAEGAPGPSLLGTGDSTNLNADSITTADLAHPTTLF
jgi:hypothetical protein